MREDAGKTKAPAGDRQEIKSEDIPNAHAAGDGAMGTNDEKLEEETSTGISDRDKKENEKGSY
jgi:hypothetical protein